MKTSLKVMISLVLVIALALWLVAAGLLAKWLTPKLGFKPSSDWPYVLWAVIAFLPIWAGDRWLNPFLERYAKQHWQNQDR